MHGPRVGCTQPQPQPPRTASRELNAAIALVVGEDHSDEMALRKARRLVTRAALHDMAMACDIRAEAV